jgi:hypothetical protein
MVLHNEKLHKLLHAQQGVVTPDVYTTAWVALVPAVHDLGRPAWPQALTYVRRHQLNDGGWGEPHIYNAHERTICTLAALRALLEWREADDQNRIERGVQALHRYALDLSKELHQPVGFELLLPRLAHELKRFNLDLAIEAWTDTVYIGMAKLALIGDLRLGYQQPRAWWFSLEMMSESYLAQLDERILNHYGAVATSTAATAAYLRALRLHRRDSRRATTFLEYVLTIGNGGAGFCWPIEVFELAWTLDNLARAAFSPTDPAIAPLVQRLANYWHSSPLGLSSSQAFSVSDGDDTSMAYHILRWGGLKPSSEPFLAFWDTDHFCTYHDERTASVTVNIHALAGLRHDLARWEYKKMAILLTEWLRQQFMSAGGFSDKWHFSPFYVAAHGVSALAGWDNELAQQCVRFLLNGQHNNGGWGHSGYATLEETCHAALGLVAAQQAGLLKDEGPLKSAAVYLQMHKTGTATERLWMGKTLFQPVGVVQLLLYATRVALARQKIVDLSYQQRPRLGRYHFPA